jgi:hypothetical protein
MRARQAAGASDTATPAQPAAAPSAIRKVSLTGPGPAEVSPGAAPAGLQVAAAMVAPR